MQHQKSHATRTPQEGSGSMLHSDISNPDGSLNGIPGLDPHLDKADLWVFFKLSSTLVHEKLNPDSALHDNRFPRPIYISTRKPVWLLSELMAWQQGLKARRPDQLHSEPAKASENR